MHGLDDGYFVVSSGHMGGLDDGYFVVESGHTGLGIDKEELAKQKAIDVAREAMAASIRAKIARGESPGGALGGTNWMLWGGLAAAAAAIGFVVLRKRKKG